MIGSFIYLLLLRYTLWLELYCSTIFSWMEPHYNHQEYRSQWRALIGLLILLKRLFMKPKFWEKWWIMDYRTWLIVICDPIRRRKSSWHRTYPWVWAHDWTWILGQKINKLVPFWPWSPINKHFEAFKLPETANQVICLLPKPFTSS